MIIIQNKLFIFLGLLVAGIVSFSPTTPVFAQEDEVQEEVVKGKELKDEEAVPEVGTETEEKSSESSEKKESNGNDEEKPQGDNTEGLEN